MATDYNGLTRNTWPGTWSSSGTHPIVLDREVRGGLRYISGDVGDQLTDIEGQRIQEGMLVYVKNTYDSVTGDKYYVYKLQAGETRDPSTGAMPNSAANWSEVLFGADGVAIEEGTGIEIQELGQSSVISLTDTAVVPDTYGDRYQIPRFSVDQQGRITSITTIPVPAGKDLFVLAQVPLSGLQDEILFDIYGIEYIVNYTARDSQGRIVAIDATILEDRIVFESNVDLSNFNIEIEYLGVQIIISQVSTFAMSGTSYTVEFDINNIGILLNHYVLSPEGKIVETDAIITTTNITIEANIDLSGHVLYLISQVAT